MTKIDTERELIAVALALIGSKVSLSSAERHCRKGITPCRSAELVNATRCDIIAGNDPLGSAFARIRPALVRRENGATYTPQQIVDSMVTWASSEATTPVRVVDAGAGSGRFLLAAAKCFPEAELVGIESDPLAALMLRANFACMGLTHRLALIVGDYRKARLPKIEGVTLFIGNPPYVRHHRLSDADKSWFSRTAASYGVKASKLAGLHIHFFLRTLQLAKVGDFGVFITSAEWLDVNYGATLRQLLAGELGGAGLHVLDAEVMPFSDATTTGAITCFRVGRRPANLKVRAVATLNELNGLNAGNDVPWCSIEAVNRWSIIVKPGPRTPAGYIELGELCRVHRGQVTGSNGVWIAGQHTAGLPDAVLTPTVTKARDLLTAGHSLTEGHKLRRVVDLPADLGELEDEFLPSIERFLAWAKEQGADQSYIAQHRRAWWSVGLKKPAPIICTYMARRAPAFVRNLCDARHINIAHGLYPRDQLSGRTLDAIAAWLRSNVEVTSGRTYAGGLTKFEPKEIERLAIPRLEDLPS
ncbi:Eco57I restriction-modification methylase domain-containing protein [Paraburkholderia phenoliruptrix]|uniref:Eco57I restriction-modification methylase domain-containing protein n=1 Tax=Paraburkholderia phenoliruptrix TaxID=252970 RepID=UPI002869A383|nr:N-6 DNA methylase [Paraburkholderia phenoliruptrix]WMY07738.1 N-6 DNA methylase [Paraburkholderia phenoliruptrix]